MRPERAWFLSEGEKSDLGGGTASRSPFQRFRCLPFSDASKRPATKGSYPLGTPRCFAEGQSSEAEWELVFLAGENQRVTNPQASPPITEKNASTIFLTKAE
jgi:hypothetical protein